MGYNFILARMRAPQASHPVRIPGETSAAVLPLDDMAPLHDALRRAIPMAPQALDIHADASVTWHTPDGGTLDLLPSALAINIDTHAGWDHVATLFELMREVWPETALMDFQTGHLHDPASFRAFVDRTRRQPPGHFVRESAARDPGDAGG